jgi:hypothetical protein
MSGCEARENAREAVVEVAKRIRKENLGGAFRARSSMDSV